MPIKTSCPDCNRSYNLADTMNGKTVKCKECGSSFTVENVAGVVAAGDTPATRTKTGLSAPAKTTKIARKPGKRPSVKKNNTGLILMIVGGAAAAFLFLAVGGSALAWLLWPSPKKSDDAVAALSTTAGTDIPTTPPPKETGTNPNPTSKPTSPVTKENFDKIKGGMIVMEVNGLLANPSNWNASLSADTANYDQATVHFWQNGADSVTVTYCSQKVAHWVGVFGGQTYTMEDSAYILTKPSPSTTTTPPKPGSQITKDNFDKIKGGMMDVDLRNLLGQPTRASAPVDAAVKPLVGTKGKAQVWQNGSDSITVSYYNGKATHWVGMIGGETLGPVDDANFAFKPNAPNKPANQVTKANYNLIGMGQQYAAIVQLLGNPTNVTQPVVTPATKTKAATSKFQAQWTDGQTGEITIHFTNGLVATKSERGLK